MSCRTDLQPDPGLPVLTDFPSLLPAGYIEWIETLPFDELFLRKKKSTEFSGPRELKQYVVETFKRYPISKLDYGEIENHVDSSLDWKSVAAFYKMAKALEDRAKFLIQSTSATSAKEAGVIFLADCSKEISAGEFFEDAGLSRKIRFREKSILKFKWESSAYDTEVEFGNALFDVVPEVAGKDMLIPLDLRQTKVLFTADMPHFVLCWKSAYDSVKFEGRAKNVSVPWCAIVGVVVLKLDAAALEEAVSQIRDYFADRTWFAKSAVFVAATPSSCYFIRMTRSAPGELPSATHCYLKLDDSVKIKKRAYSSVNLFLQYLLGRYPPGWYMEYFKHMTWDSTSEFLKEMKQINGASSVNWVPRTIATKNDVNLGKRPHGAMVFFRARKYGKLNFDLVVKAHPSEKFSRYERSVLSQLSVKKIQGVPRIVADVFENDDAIVDFDGIGWHLVPMSFAGELGMQHLGKMLKSSANFVSEGKLWKHIQRVVAKVGLILCNVHLKLKLVHCDVKPSNIVVSANFGRRKHLEPTLIDWEMAIPIKTGRVRGFTRKFCARTLDGDDSDLMEPSPVWDFESLLYSTFFIIERSAGESSKDEIFQLLIEGDVDKIKSKVHFETYFNNNLTFLSKAVNFLSEFAKLVSNESSDASFRIFFDLSLKQ